MTGRRGPSLVTMLSKDTASIIALLFLFLPLFVTGIGWLRLTGKGRSLAPEDLIWPIASVVIIPPVLVWRIRVLAGFFSRCVEVTGILTTLQVAKSSGGGSQSFATVAYQLGGQHFHETVMFLEDMTPELGHLPAGAPIQLLVDPKDPRQAKLAQLYPNS